jgi:hypothetical protein
MGFMRVITLGRLIGIAVILLMIGFLPTALSVGADIVSRSHEWWPPQLSIQTHLTQLSEFWRSLAETFSYLKIAGFVLLGVGILWAVLVNMDGLPWIAAKPPTPPERTSNVLLREAELIHGATPAPEIRQAIDLFDAQRREDATDSGDEGPLNEMSPAAYQWLNTLNRTALCLSGGGIRSASFALGVLQALAVHPRQPDDDRHVDSPQNSLLAQFNFLSTVSGGGYIGSWFSAWISRHNFPFVWSCLVRRPNESRDPGLEPRAIAWLREHGNYLTPQLGLTSPDTLTTVAIFLRNLLLNWLVLLPLLVAPLIAMKLLALIIFAVSYHNSLPLFFVFGFLGLVLLFGALRFSLRNRPSRNRDDVRRKSQADQSKVIKRGLLPYMAAAFAFTICMALAAATKADGKYTGWLGTLFPLNTGRLELANLVLVGAVCGTFMYALSWITSWPRVRGVDDFWRWTLSGTIYGVLVGLVVYFFANDYIGDWIFYSFSDWFWHLWGLFFSPRADDLNPDLYKHQLVLIHLGVPLLLGAQLVAEMIFVGLSSYQKYSDDDREWLGRASALALLAGVSWLVVMYLIYVGGDIAYKMIKNPMESLLLFGALYLTSVFSAAVGRSEHTPAQAPATGQKPRPAHAILSVVAIICALLLIVVASAVIDLAVLGHPITARADNSLAKDAFLLGAALIVVLLLGVNASKVINVNRFSMHALYRNRLVRTFLGATRDPRDANPFTNFDEEDNPRMSDLWGPSGQTGIKPPQPGEHGWQPFHVINIALNITASEKHLAWQERKAAPFVVTPLHCGGAVTGFRSSKEYGDNISLGTAMAISGAAASPNHGYNSSPPVAFLMALLNVRLGWWLGNTGRAGAAAYRFDGPKTAARSLLSELLGLTREDQEYVYLSDGGHFENLGIYEMVRRRCRFIVVSDAGCDPNFAFEDLGNAVRKIQIDLGVPIRFDGLSALKPRPFDGRDLGPGHPYHAIGEVDYPAADGGGKKGIILYIKPGYHGSETSAGVRSYAIANSDYPHDSTANQWFGESQMESYRALGFEVTDNLIREALESLKGVPRPQLKDVLQALKNMKPEAPPAVTPAQA